MITDFERNTIRQRCDAEWKASPRLREEFNGDFRSFLAYTTAKGQGLVTDAITDRVVTGGYGRGSENVIFYQR